MKTKFSFLFLLFFVFYIGTAQVPQGFNYQAVARDVSTNNILANTTLQVMLYIQSTSTGGTIFWKELHNPVVTNSLGLFTVVLGNGTRQTASTVASFDLIDWSVSPKYVKTEIYYSGAWRDMGAAAQLWSVPYSLTAKNLAGAGKLNIKGTTSNVEEALFEVKNKDNQTVFAVYNEGVRVYVSDGNKGSKGGFAVGGFDQAKAWNQEYLRVTSDSTRIYTNAAAAKGAKGGFAVGGFDATKENVVTPFTSLTPENYFIGHESGLKTNPDLGGKFNNFFGYQTGKFNIIGANNVYLGYQSGMASTASNNVFIGYQSGIVNTSGFNNIFLGYKAGWSNTIGDNDVFIGSESGYKYIGGSTRGDGNVFIGYLAGHEDLIGAGNSFVGFQSGYNNKGKQNAFFGNNSGQYNTDGNYNVYIGPYAGRGSATETVNASNNVFIGNYAGQSVTTGSNNAIIGFQSGRALGTGNYNVFVGDQAGYSNQDGQYNTFIGYQAGHENIGGTGVWEGEYNTFLGYQAGYNSTSGYRNIAIGYQAGYGFTSNRYNVCIGEQTGSALADGQGNVFIGTYTGESNNGTGNVLLGLDAGWSNATGNNNVMIGLGSGRSATGSNNVFLGLYSGYGETGNNKLVIENNYTGSDNASNALIYGDFLNNTLRLNGSVGVNVNPGAAKLYVVDDGTTIGIRGDATLLGSGSRYGVYGYGAGGTGYNHGVFGSANGGSQTFGVWGTANAGSTWTIGVFGTTAGGTGRYAVYASGDMAYTGGIYDLSDKNFKKDIEPITGALDKILKINGISYKFKSENELPVTSKALFGNDGENTPSLYNLPEGKQLGVIAQDVENVLPELVKTNPDGYKMVDYVKIVPVLVEAIREQQKMIDQLRTEIEALKKK
jgi:hypothetical protein